MFKKKNIFIIIGSASKNSANEMLARHFAMQTNDLFEVTIFNTLKTLPHFDPERSSNNPPQEVVAFRDNIAYADGIIICTPEYVFSIPSGLKNALEWCVATTMFTDKPVGLITASTSGEKGHEELRLIMSTVMANFTDETTLLIQGIKGEINKEGQVTDDQTKKDFIRFIDAFKKLTD